LQAVKSLHTVVQLEEFIRSAKSLMTDEERERIVDAVAAAPESGTALGGGLWKMRVARSGGGKSGGFRTVYLFIGDDVPIFLLTVFAKNKKDDLTPTEKAILVEFGKALAKSYGAAR
jgi:hypothetical protein